MKNYKGNKINEKHSRYAVLLGDSLFAKAPLDKAGGTEQFFYDLPVSEQSEEHRVLNAEDTIAVPYFFGKKADVKVQQICASGAAVKALFNNDGLSYKNVGRVGDKIIFEPNYILVSFGTNDLAQSVAFGTQSAMYSNGWARTLWGYYGEMFSYYRMKFPSARIGFVIDGALTEEYISTMKNICDFWGVGILNMFDYPQHYLTMKGKTLGVSPVPLGKSYQGMPSLSLTQPRTSDGQCNYQSAGVDITNITDYLGMRLTYDNLHPSLDAIKYKARVMAEWLKTL